MGPKCADGWMPSSEVAVPDFVLKTGTPCLKLDSPWKSGHILPQLKTNTPLASHSSENKIFTLDHSPQGSAEPAPCLPLPLALLSLSPLFQSRHAIPPTHQAHSCLRGFVHALLFARNALPWLFPQRISSAPTSPSLTFYPKVSLSVIPSQHPVFILSVTHIHYQTLIIYLLDYCLLAPWGQGFLVLSILFTVVSPAQGQVHSTCSRKLYQVDQRQYSQMVRCAGFGGSKLSNHGSAVYCLHDLGQVLASLNFSFLI